MIDCSARRLYRAVCMAGEAVGRESCGDRARTSARELRPQLSTLSTTSSDAMFSAPGPMQTSTPGYLPLPTCTYTYLQ